MLREKRRKRMEKKSQTACLSTLNSTTCDLCSSTSENADFSPKNQQYFLAEIQPEHAPSTLKNADSAHKTLKNAASARKTATKLRSNLSYRCSAAEKRSGPSTLKNAGSARKTALKMSLFALRKTSKLCQKTQPTSVLLA